MSGVPFSRSTQESTVLSIAAHTSPAVVRVAGLQVADESLFEVRGVTERGVHVHLLCSYIATHIRLLKNSGLGSEGVRVSDARLTRASAKLPAFDTAHVWKLTLRRILSIAAHSSHTTLCLSRRSSSAGLASHTSRMFEVRGVTERGIVVHVHPVSLFLYRDPPNTSY